MGNLQIVRYFVPVVAVMLSACAATTPTKMTYDEVANFQINCQVAEQQIMLLESQKHSQLDQLMSMSAISKMFNQQALANRGVLTHHTAVADGDYNRMIDYVISRIRQKC